MSKRFTQQIPKPIRLFSCIALILAVLSVQSLHVAHAATLTVTNLNDSGSGSLRQAIIDAVSGDTINFSVTGTITLGSQLSISNKALTITGPGQGQLTLSGNDNSRMFYIDALTRTVTITGMTLTRGKASQDGIAIYVANGSAVFGDLLVTNNAFVNATATSCRGTIYHQGAMLTVTNSTFSNNDLRHCGGVSSFGGGVYVSSLSNPSLFYVTGSVFSNNFAYNYGGAIYSETVTQINGTSFVNNTASFGPGGAYFGTTPLTVTSSSFDGNNSPTYGGAIYDSNSIVSATNTTFTNNSATSSGGAIYSGGLITIQGGSFSGNSATSGGALIGQISLQNATLSNNTATGSGSSGGAVYLTGAASTISGSTFINNTAPNGSGGAVYGSGNSISNSTFTGNGALNGGALSTNGPISISKSTFANNTAQQNGGAIMTNSDLTVVNITISNNQAIKGGGIYIPTGGGTTNLIGVTIAGNQASALGGGIFIDPAAAATNIKIRNSLLSANTALVGANISGTFTSYGYNLVSSRTDSTGYTTSDLPDGTAAGIGALMSNGGLTQTISLLQGSAAIDVIPSGGGCNGAGTLTDQRGITRAQGANCDIGAFEKVLPRPDTIGMYKNGIWYLRNTNSSGAADISFTFGGAPTHLPIVGDWNGDGVDTAGIYDTGSGVFALRDSNSTGAADYSITLGNPGDTPLAGKWDTQITHDGIGVYRNSNGILYLRRDLSTGFSDYAMVMGNAGDIGIAGDWDNNGYDSIGVYRPSSHYFYLSNMNGNGVTFADVAVDLDINGGVPFTGDWTGTGQSRVGWFVGGIVYQRYFLTPGLANNAFVYGPADALPVAGKWVAASVPTFTSPFDPRLQGIIVQPGHAVPPGYDNSSSDSTD